MNRKNVLLCLISGIAIAMLAGCGSKPSNADLMRGHVSQVQAQGQAESELKDQLAKDWEKGQALVESGSKNIKAGEKRVESGERDMRRGKDQIEAGHRELAEGTELVQRSEQRFRDVFSDLELLGTR